MAPARKKTVLMTVPISATDYQASNGQILTLPIGDANDLIESGQAIPISSKDRETIEDLKDRLGLAVRSIS